MEFHKHNEIELIIDIKRELQSQDNKWGEQKHTIYKWLSIIGEEVGELHKEALEMLNVNLITWNSSKFKKELLQVITLLVRLLYTPYDRDYDNNVVFI